MEELKQFKFGQNQTSLLGQVDLPDLLSPPFSSTILIGSHHGPTWIPANYSDSAHCRRITHAVPIFILTRLTECTSVGFGHKQVQGHYIFSCPLTCLARDIFLHKLQSSTSKKTLRGS